MVGRERQTQNCVEWESEAMWASHTPFFPPLIIGGIPRHHHRSSAFASSSAPGSHHQKKKVVVVGSGWAGLSSAHHLTKQGFDVTILEDGSTPSPEVGIKGFWYPYHNIFSLVDELGIKPFTNWTRSAHYSAEGLEVQFPVFQDQIRLPTPLGVLLYLQFPNLPILDQLASLPLIAAVVDFDNTDTAWRKYDTFTSRELFRRFGCSESLYRKVFEPLLQVGLFAPAEQCSAAATLGLLYYYFLSHQENFDVRWCRGTIREKILFPWLKSLTVKGLKFYQNKKVTDFVLDEESGCISELLCGQDAYKADAYVLDIGISPLQSAIMNSPLLQSRQEFLNVLNLSTIDVITVKLWFDKKVRIPNAANICSGFEDSIAWTFFDLSSIYDEYQDETATVLEAKFYSANQLIYKNDKEIVMKVLSCLSNCIKDLNGAVLLQNEVARFPKSATHFFPGSYKYMMRGSTSFPNLFMAGDWIVNRHGSWSQEKAYVTGLEAANRVVDFLGEGEFAKIIAVDDDEPHIETFRNLKRNFDEIRSQLPFSDFFLE